MTQKKDEKETIKTKTGLFDYILESSIKSSKTITSIVNELLILSEEINSLRLSLLSLSKVIQTHQSVIEDIYKVLEQASLSSKKNNDITIFSLENDKKKDKPN